MLAISVGMSLGSLLGFHVLRLASGVFPMVVLTGAAQGAIWLDQLLVRHLTWAVGTRWHGGGRARIARWAHLLGIYTVAAVALAVGPDWMAAMATLLGLVGVLAISRQWSWDEADRRAGVEAGSRRLRIDDDLVDEGLFGIALLLLLLTGVIVRLDANASFLHDPRHLGWLRYPAFLGEQLFQATPIVGNADVYGYGKIGGVEARAGIGQTMTFATRTAFELIILAGLLRAIATARAIATGADLRRQEELLVGDDAEGVHRALRKLVDWTVGGNGRALDLLQRTALPDQQSAAPRWRTRFAATRALVAVGLRTEQGSSPYFSVAAEALRRLTDESPAGSPDKGEAALELAMPLGLLGDRDGGRTGQAKLREAATVARMAAELLPPERMFNQWLNARVVLTHGLRAFGERCDPEVGSPLLEKAVNVGLETLKLVGPGPVQEERANHMRNLVDQVATALRALGERDASPRGTENLAFAARLYREMLVPMEHGIEASVLRTNLTAILVRLAGRQEPELARQTLEEAAALLDPETLDTVHLAMPGLSLQSVNTLATAHLYLGLQRGGPDAVPILRQAVQGFRKVLDLTRRDDAAGYWANVQNNLALGIRILCEAAPSDDAAALLDEAIGAAGYAIEVFDPETNTSQWTIAQFNLATILQVRGTVTQGPEREQFLQRSIETAKLVLATIKDGMMDVDRGTARNNLGNSYLLLSEGCDGEAREALLEQACAAYRGALDDHQQDQRPLDWAFANSNLANALGQLGDVRQCHRETLELAREAAIDALTVFDELGTPYFWAITRLRLAAACFHLGRVDDPAALREARMILDALAEHPLMEAEPLLGEVTALRERLETHALKKLPA